MLNIVEIIVLYTLKNIYEYAMKLFK